MSSKTFRDGSYNPLWPLESPTVAAVLVMGGGDGGSGSAMQFDDIRIRLGGTGGWIAEADDAGHTWRGTSDCYAGAVLALLADRIGLRAEVTLKPDREGGPDD